MLFLSKCITYIYLNNLSLIEIFNYEQINNKYLCVG